MSLLLAASQSGPVRDLAVLDLALAAGLVLIAVGISRRHGLGLEKDMLIAAVRTVVQLILLGYAVGLIFSIDRWWAVTALLAGMVGYGGVVAARRVKLPIPGLWITTSVALLIGSGLVSVAVIGGIVRPEQWYDPRYAIPLVGMIVGNSMNAGSVAMERFAAELAAREDEVEAWLSLGAEPAKACSRAAAAGIRAGLISVLNTMAVVGIVNIPGMMTGQIIGGSDPVTAAKYQILVMFMLLATNSLTAALAVVLGRRHFFTRDWQIRRDRLPSG